jgi:hypothetical protein
LGNLICSNSSGDSNDLVSFIPSIVDLMETVSKTYSETGPKGLVKNPAIPCLFLYTTPDIYLSVENVDTSCPLIFLLY